MQNGSRFHPSPVGASLSGAIAGLSETAISEVAMSVFGDPDVVPMWFGEGDLVTPDFVTIAKGFGCHAERVADPAALAAALECSPGRRMPSLIEIDEAAWFAATGA